MIIISFLYPKYTLHLIFFHKFIYEARIKFSFIARVLEVSTSVGVVFMDILEYNLLIISFYSYSFVSFIFLDIIFDSGVL